LVTEQIFLRCPWLDDSVSVSACVLAAAPARKAISNRRLMASRKNQRSPHSPDAGTFFLTLVPRGAAKLCLQCCCAPRCRAGRTGGSVGLLTLSRLEPRGGDSRSYAFARPYATPAGLLVVGFFSFLRAQRCCNATGPSGSASLSTSIPASSGYLDSFPDAPRSHRSAQAGPACHDLELRSRLRRVMFAAS